MKAIVPVHVERKILVLRGERVMLDADLAELYEVETRSLIQAVKRNAARFPADFMFQLTEEETAILRSQTGISSAAHGGRRYVCVRRSKPARHSSAQPGGLGAVTAVGPGESARAGVDRA
jgi:hypothetical protein